MKRAFYLLTGALLGSVLGALLAYCFNTWYTARFVQSDADSDILIWLTLFVFFPASIVLGILTAYRIHLRTTH